MTAIYSLRDRSASPRHCETERPETETRPVLRTTSLTQSQNTFKLSFFHCFGKNDWDLQLHKMKKILHHISFSITTVLFYYQWGIALLVCWSKISQQVFDGLPWNIHGPQRMNLTNFGDPLTVTVPPPAGICGFKRNISTTGWIAMTLLVHTFHLVASSDKNLSLITKNELWLCDRTIKANQFSFQYWLRLYKWLPK